jgi:hypothetical protein
VSEGELALLHKLDSLKNSSSSSKYFAGLYYNTTVKSVNYFLTRPEKEKDFNVRFELSFAEFFFRSVDARAQSHAIPWEWKTYFADSALSPLQYKLIGINAHINGDIWQTLTSGFSLKEIQENREAYFAFQNGLIRQYNEFYTEARKGSAKIWLIHVVTAGLDKLYGKQLLLRWRKRQLQLAILYFVNRQKFETKLRKLHQKMEHINRMILRHL